MKTILAGVGVSILLGGGIWAVGRFLPGYLVGKVKGFFDWAKAAPWFRDSAKPWRWKWLQATAGMLEEEIPEPGQGKELYKALGEKIAGSCKVLAGTGAKWADALEKCGDALDTELEAEVKSLDNPPVVPPAAPPAA